MTLSGGEELHCIRPPIDVARPRAGLPSSKGSHLPPVPNNEGMERGFNTSKGKPRESLNVASSALEP